MKNNLYICVLNNYNMKYRIKEDISGFKVEVETKRTIGFWKWKTVEKKWFGVDAYGNPHTYTVGELKPFDSLKSAKKYVKKIKKGLRYYTV